MPTPPPPPPPPPSLAVVSDIPVDLPAPSIGEELYSNEPYPPPVPPLSQARTSETASTYYEDVAVSNESAAVPLDTYEEIDKELSRALDMLNVEEQLYDDVVTTLPPPPQPVTEVQSRSVAADVDLYDDVDVKDDDPLYARVDSVRNN
jgi:hypothetical protein